MRLSVDVSGLRRLRQRLRAHRLLSPSWRSDDSLFNALGTAPGVCLLRGVDSAVRIRHVAGDSVAAEQQKNNGAKRKALIRWSEELAFNGPLSLAASSVW